MRKQFGQVWHENSSWDVTLIRDRQDQAQGFRSLQQKNKARSLEPLLLFLLVVTVPFSVLAQAYPPFGSAIPNVSLTGSAPIQEPPPNPPDQQSHGIWNWPATAIFKAAPHTSPSSLMKMGAKSPMSATTPAATMNPLTGVVEPNGTSIVDVTDPAKPKYLAHIPGSTEAGEEAGGAQMVRVCSGSVLPHGVRGKWYLLRPQGSKRRKFMMSPIRRTLFASRDRGWPHDTHKNWWECDTGIAYLVANESRKAGRAAAHEDL